MVISDDLIAKLRERESSASAFDTDAALHERFTHPDFEYATTSGPRKAWYDSETPPEGDGWERNVDRCGGWERLDYHEESYWRRRKP